MPEIVVPIPLALPFLCAVFPCFILLPFYHTATDKATSLLLSGEKVTQKHFHTAAPLGRQYESAFARSREAIRTVAHPQIKLTSLIPRAFNSISFNRLIIGLFEWKILRHFYIVIGIIYFKLHNRICAFEYQTIFFSFRINFNYKISAILFLLTSAGIIHSPYFYGTQKFHPFVHQIFI